MEITRRFLLGHGVKASFLLPTLAAASQPPRARSAPQPRSPVSRPLPVVMLDPGHGGKDPGAIGYTGTYEKHVALATAQELQRLLVASGRYRVRLTRPRDVFIRLEDRVAIAQAADAALFVSMHADSMPDPQVRGASVYTLADTASDAQTAALARRENAADRFAGPAYKGVSPEVARILASLVRQEDEGRIGPHAAQRGRSAGQQPADADQPGAPRQLRRAEGGRHPQRAGRDGLHVEPARRGPRCDRQIIAFW